MSDTGSVGDSGPGSATDPKVTIDVADGIATITLADVANRNALGVAFVNELWDALHTALADDAVRVILVTNEGKVFCAGADLKEASTAGRADSDSRGLAELLSAILDSPKPVVGCIAGHVVGGGVGLAASLDIAVAAADATFGFSEVRLGVAPAIISVVCLPKMRRGEAMAAFLRGNRFSAARAVELGLIADTAPRNRLHDEVAVVIADLMAGGPTALGAAKALINQVPTLTRDEAFNWTSTLSSDLFNGPEAAEGMAAFLGKRPPSWHPDADSASDT